MLNILLKKENLTEGDISKARFSGRQSLAQEKHWHVGQTVPLIPAGYDVASIQADGDELEFLLDNFTNLPMAKNASIVSWFGDMAKFVIHNIPVGMTWDKANGRTVRIKLCFLIANVVLVECIRFPKLKTLLIGQRKSKKPRQNIRKL